MTMAASDKCGCNWHRQSIEERTRNLVPLPGFIDVTSSPEKPDMITFEDGPDEKRAIMPCGHVIGPNSMAAYCQSVLSEGKFKFYCQSVDKEGKANCNREWGYFLVRYVACLSADEAKAFEKKMSENYLEKAKGFETCPGCQTWCYKTDDTKNNVRCSFCYKHFCLKCMRNWLDPDNLLSCGNSDCGGRDGKIRTLANCLTKQIWKCQECPTMRACPNCGLITEHKDKCAHVTCPTCGHGFCFVCLNGKTSSDASWPCSYNGTCTLAPRQTIISLCAPASQPTP